MIGDFILGMGIGFYDLTFGFLPLVEDLTFDEAIGDSSIGALFAQAIMAIVQVINALPFISLLWPWILATIGFWASLGLWLASYHAYKAIRG